jgi:hypothetical protein
MDMTAKVPWLLKVGSAVVFSPMRNLCNWDSPPAGHSEGRVALLGLAEMFANGLFWGIIIFLFCIVIVPRFMAK